MLDQDGFLASGNGATGSGGSTNKAGSGTGGTMNPRAVNPMLALEPCQRYCKGFQVACSAALGGRDCVSTCVAEANNGDAECQAAAIAVVDCYAPFFTPGQDCASANTRGGVACSQQVGRYDQCLSENNQPTMPGNCASVASSNDGASCFDVLTCPAGDFVVECSPSGGGKRCSCSWSNGSTSFEYASVLDACQLARSDCGLD
jgi:hypothetical protein